VNLEIIGSAVTKHARVSNDCSWICSLAWRRGKGYIMCSATYANRILAAPRALSFFLSTCTRIQHSSSPSSYAPFPNTTPQCSHPDKSASSSESPPELQPHEPAANADTEMGTSIGAAWRQPHWYELDCFRVQENPSRERIDWCWWELVGVSSRVAMTEMWIGHMLVWLSTEVRLVRLHFLGMAVEETELVVEDDVRPSWLPLTSKKTPSWLKKVAPELIDENDIVGQVPSPRVH